MEPASVEEAERGKRWPVWLPIAVPLVVGAGLRVAGLGRQVLGGDELHAVRVALARPLGAILSEYPRGSDHSVPLTALFRIWLEVVGPLTDAVLRAPPLLAALLLLVVLTVHARRWFGATAGFAVGTFLAVSPALVLYGRIVRSYSPMLLFGTLAVCALVAWLREPRGRHALAYGLWAGLAIWFHLLAAPFVLAPLAIPLVRRLRGVERAPSTRALALLLAAPLLACALLLGPAAPSMLAFVSAKASSGELVPGTLADVARFLAGTPSPALAAFLWGGVAFGAWRAGRRGSPLPAVLAVGGVAQLAAIAVSRPDLVEEPLVASRYLLIVLPGALVCLGAAFAPPHGARPWAGVMTGLAAAVLAGVLVVSGPLVEADFLASSFAHSNDAMDFLHDADVPGEVPAFYDEVAGEPGAVVEMPIEYVWRLARAPLRDQRAHGREVLVASDWKVLRDPRLALRNNLPATPAALLASGARWAVLFRDPGGEEPAMDAERAARFARQARAIEARLRVRFGPPDHVGARVLAWDLEPRR